MGERSHVLPNPSAPQVLERGRVAANDFLRRLGDATPPGSVTPGGCLRWTIYLLSFCQGGATVLMLMGRKRRGGLLQKPTQFLLHLALGCFGRNQTASCSTSCLHADSSPSWIRQCEESNSCAVKKTLRASQRGLWRCSHRCRMRITQERAHAVVAGHCWGWACQTFAFHASLAASYQLGSWWSTSRWDRAQSAWRAWYVVAVQWRY